MLHDSIADVLRWFDDLCEILDNNPADVEDWITNGADHFDELKELSERLATESTATRQFLKEFRKHPMDMCWDDVEVLRLRMVFEPEGVDDHARKYHNLAPAGTEK